METLEILGKLFDGVNRVKIMRLFLLNPQGSFGTAEIARRSKVGAGTLRRELNLLRDAHFIAKGKKGEWAVDHTFPFRDALSGLLLGGQSFSHEELSRRFKNAGRLKLLIVSGVFIQDDASRADILIVADNPKRKALERVIRGLEAEMGKELKYSILDTEEFKYRVGMYDKFIRDILDYKHDRIIDKIGF
ncbi:MAG: hypothetical protein AAB921_01500 [Patescibacteria group bacterium]